MPQVQSSNIDNSSAPISFSEVPDECPLCHRGTNPRIVTGVMIGAFNGSSTFLRVIFQCTWKDCYEAFLGYYGNEKGKQNPSGDYMLYGTAPITPWRESFPDSIVKVSPNFVEIYNQAIEAESRKLDQITGIGLRKALEFLIKDFLIEQEPTNAELIKSKLLGKCIEEHVTDANIKATAKLAAWLGNDETHYVRKWESKDISDLKVLIRLTVNWIDSVLLTQKYVKEMNP